VILAKRKCEAVIARFGEIIAKHLETVLLAEEDYIITHVPTDDDNELYLFANYGLCTTELLAGAIYGNLKSRNNVLLAGLLTQVRQKERKQHQCRYESERFGNVKGIYAVTNPRLVENKNIIVVDDVITSGATMRECALELKKAGARNVMGIALARTEKIGSDCMDEVGGKVA
jgi:predicted amidophosphoribosyltransferase